MATADLLHLLLERAAGLGVLGLDDLVGLPRMSAHPQAAKLRLTQQLPALPGRVPVPRRRRRGALRRQGHQPAPAGAQLLRQRRPAQDRPAAARDAACLVPRHRRSAHRRGAGDALPARAGAAVQPGRHHVAAVLLRAPHHRRVAAADDRQRAARHRPCTSVRCRRGRWPRTSSTRCRASCPLRRCSARLGCTPRLALGDDAVRRRPSSAWRCARAPARPTRRRYAEPSRHGRGGADERAGPRARPAVAAGARRSPPSAATRRPPSCVTGRRPSPAAIRRQRQADALRAAGEVELRLGDDVVRLDHGGPRRCRRHPASSPCPCRWPRRRRRHLPAPLPRAAADEVLLLARRLDRPARRRGCCGAPATGAAPPPPSPSPPVCPAPPERARRQPTRPPRRARWTPAPGRPAPLRRARCRSSRRPRRGRRAGRPPARRPPAPAAALSSTMLRCGPCSPASTRRTTSALCAGVAADQLVGDRRRQAERHRVDGERAHLVVLQREHGRDCPVVVSSSRPLPCTTQAPVRAVQAQRGQHPLGDRRVGHADQLAAHPPGVGHRAEQVEHRRDADLPPARGGEAERRVVARARGRSRCRPRRRSA